MYSIEKDISAIYMIKNTQNGKAYIGQSLDLRRRFAEHRYELRHGSHFNQHLQRAWDFYGESSFSFIILERCRVDELDKKEIEYIAKFDSVNTGYNLTDGGNALRGELNPFYGKRHTPETKARISAANKGRYAGEKNPRYGKPMPREIVERAMATKRARGIPRGGNANNAHAVVCLSTGEYFPCIKEAADYYCVPFTCIVQNCTGRSKSVKIDGNYTAWAYLEDYLSMPNDEIVKRNDRAVNMQKMRAAKKMKPVICLTTGEIYNSAREAATQLALDYSTISKVCRGVNKSHGRDKATGEPLRWAFYYSDSDSRANHFNGAI